MSALDRHLRSTAAALETVGGHVETLERWGRDVATRLCDGRRLLAAGNGGSAAQAQHLTAELVGRYSRERPPLAAVALHADTSSLTAVANDYGLEEAFARQVDAHGRPGDVLVALSTSGRSPNVVAAARRARGLGLVTLALTGPAPNPLAGCCDTALAVHDPSAAVVQEAHLVMLHLLCEAIDECILGPDRVEEAVG